MNNDQILDWLISNSEFMNMNDILLSVIRKIGWLFINLLCKLADACESLYTIVFDLIDFTTWNVFENFVSDFNYVFLGLLAVAIFALGLILVLNHEKRPKILISICIAAFVISGSSAALSSINTVLKEWNSALLETSASSATDLVKGNLLDWLYIDSKTDIADVNENNAESFIYDTFTDKDLALINITETIDYEEAELSENGKDIFSKKVIYGNNGASVLGDIEKGLLDVSFLGEYYYRYHVDYFTLILKLLAMILVYLCMAYKVVQLIMEIVQARIVAVLYSADITSTQKISRILCSIRDSYFVLLLITVFVKVYILVQTYIDTSIDANDFVKAIMILFVAFTVMDGPAFIQQLTGIDAGLKSGWGKIFAATQIVSMFKNGGNREFMDRNSSENSNSSRTNERDGDSGAGIGATFIPSRNTFSNSSDIKNGVGNDAGVSSFASSEMENNESMERMNSSEQKEDERMDNNSTDAEQFSQEEVENGSNSSEIQEFNDFDELGAGQTQQETGEENDQISSMGNESNNLGFDNLDPITGKRSMDVDTSSLMEKDLKNAASIDNYGTSGIQKMDTVQYHGSKQKTENSKVQKDIYSAELNEEKKVSIPDRKDKNNGKI